MLRFWVDQFWHFGRAAHSHRHVAYVMELAVCAQIKVRLSQIQVLIVVRKDANSTLDILC